MQDKYEDPPPCEPVPPAPDTLPAPPPELDADDPLNRLERLWQQQRIESLAKADSVRDELGGKIAELTAVARDTQNGLRLMFELQERYATDTRNVVADAIKAGMSELGEFLRAGLAEIDRRVDNGFNELDGKLRAAGTIFEGHHVKIAELDRRLNDIEDHPHLHAVNGNGTAE